MIKITVFDVAGTILRNVTCPVNMTEIQAQPGEAIIEGEFSHETHFIDPVQLVAIEKPAKPDGDFQFDIASRSWVATQYTDAELIAAAKLKRAQLLSATDWTQLPDVPTATQLLWAPYRQALRDLNMQSVRSIVWPTPPA